MATTGVLYGGVPLLNRAGNPVWHDSADGSPRACCCPTTSSSGGTVCCGFETGAPDELFMTIETNCAGIDGEIVTLDNNLTAAPFYESADPTYTVPCAGHEDVSVRFTLSCAASGWLLSQSQFASPTSFAVISNLSPISQSCDPFELLFQTTFENTALPDPCCTDGEIVFLRVTR